MNDRTLRISADLEALNFLQQASTIFTFQTQGDPPERFTLRFRGSGLQRGNAPNTEPEILREHEIEIRLPMSYPHLAPDVRWISPLFHPNVSYSGFVNLTDVALEWSPEMGLDLICERLWDVLRLAQFDNDKACNYTAKKWLEEQQSFALPLDPRPLRDRAAGVNRNVVKYRRRGQAEPREIPAEDVIYIDDDVPAPPLPPVGAQPVLRSRAIVREDDDILYIE